ncbi:MAG: hypothetical protein GWP05_06060 [Anaerolineaceae bacterium]|nr:hypothetical protein [Anaerolineaceae bacterium]
MPDHYAGRGARCPTCSRRLRVPRRRLGHSGALTPDELTDSQATSGIVMLDGHAYQVRPQVEGMVVASSVIIALSVVPMILVGLTIGAYTPWLWASLVATGVVLFGMLLVLPGYANIRRSRGRKTGRRLGMINIAAGLALISGFLSVGLISYALADHSSCRSRMLAIHKALMQYAARNDLRFPPRPETLVAEGYLKAGKLTCPKFSGAREGAPTYNRDSYVEDFSGKIDLRTDTAEFPGDLMVLMGGSVHRSPKVVDRETGRQIPFHYALRLKADRDGEVVGYVPLDEIRQRIVEQRKIIARVLFNRSIDRDERKKENLKPEVKPIP